MVGGSLRQKGSIKLDEQITDEADKNGVNVTPRKFGLTTAALQKPGTPS